MKTTHEQRAEWAQHAQAYKRLGPLHKGSDADVIATAVPALLADLEEAQAKLAAAEKDADRYLEIFTTEKVFAVCVWIGPLGKWSPCVSKHAADYALDAAIAARKEQP